MSGRIVVPIETRPEPKRRKVLVPLDGSKQAEAVLDSSLVAGEVDFMLLRVVPVTIGPLWTYVPKSDRLTPDAFADAKEEAEFYLADVAERLGAWAHHVHTQVILEVSVAQAITDYAAAHEVALIAMATHGRSGIKRAVLGSVAEGVMRNSTVPVLLLPAQAAERAEAAFAVAPAM